MIQKAAKASSFTLAPSDSLIDLSKHEAFLVKCFEEKLAELNRIYKGTDH
jgi:hypothetical protein